MKHFRLLPLACFGFLVACGERYSPWETDVPPTFQSLTSREIDRLNDLPSSELPFTFAVMADPQGTPKDFERTVDAINRRADARFFLILGDLTDHGLLHEYEWAGDALLRSRIPFFTAVGNHDAISHGKAIYSKMFGPFDYTFEYAGLKFVMFNNNQYEFGETDFSWLEREVDNRTIAGSHIPPVLDVHRSDQIEEWTRINQEAGILASLHGHRGSRRSFFWEAKSVPYYIAPRARGVRYSLVTVEADRTVRFASCQHDTCEDEQ